MLDQPGPLLRPCGGGILARRCREGFRGLGFRVEEHLSQHREYRVYRFRVFRFFFFFVGGGVEEVSVSRSPHFLSCFHLSLQLKACMCMKQHIQN